MRPFPRRPVRVAIGIVPFRAAMDALEGIEWKSAKEGKEALAVWQQSLPAAIKEPGKQLRPSKCLIVRLAVHIAIAEVA